MIAELVDFTELAANIPGLPSRRRVERMVALGEFPGTRLTPHSTVIYDLAAVRQWIADRAGVSQ